MSRLAASPRRAWSATPSHSTALLLLIPLAIAVAAFVLYPLVKLVGDSFADGGLQNYSDAFSGPLVRRALVTTLLYAAGVTVVAVAVGWGLAWTVRTTSSRLVKALVWAGVMLPFWMGVVVKNYAFTVLLANNGVVNELLTGIGLADRPVQLLYTPGAVIVGIAYAMIPYAFFGIYAVLSSVDLGLPAAAQSLGATRTRAIRTTVLPLALPGIVASAALVFAISIGFYVTPVLLGGAQTPFMATLIQDDIFTYNDPTEAATASVLLLLCALLVLGATFKAVGRERLLRAIA